MKLVDVLKGYNPNRGADGKFTSGAGTSGNSPEYDKALTRHSAAQREYKGAVEQYRAKQIGDKEYLAARAKYNEATKQYDEAYSREEFRSIRQGPGQVALVAEVPRSQMLEAGELPKGKWEQGHRVGETKGFEYATNGVSIFRRPASHKGTYGGWRWERDDTAHDRKTLTEQQGVTFLTTKRGKRA